MERRFDRPRPTSFNFNANDQANMRRVCQQVVELLIRMQREGGAIEIGVFALALANVTKDLLDKYPANLRNKIIREINSQIFQQAPAIDGAPRLVTFTH